MSGLETIARELAGAAAELKSSNDAAARRSLREFHVTHMDKAGNVHEYDAIFRCSVDAVKDCVQVFGPGRIKVEAN